MRKVYESFLDLLMGVTRDTFEQPAFDVESVLEMPELHLQSLADMSCFHALYAANQRRCCGHSCHLLTTVALLDGFKRAAGAR